MLPKFIFTRSVCVNIRVIKNQYSIIVKCILLMRSDSVIMIEKENAARLDSLAACGIHTEHITVIFSIHNPLRQFGTEVFDISIVKYKFIFDNWRNAMNEEKMIFPAHIRLEQHGEQTEKIVQTVAQHCNQVAEYAEHVLQSIGLGKTARLAGKLHDCGKSKKEFKLYVEQNDGKKRGSVNHTFAGVRFLLENYHTSDGAAGYEDLVCELIAFAVGAHHGLFDCINEKRKSGFLHRLEASDTEIRYQESIRNYLHACTDKKELDQLFQEAVEEIKVIVPKIENLCCEEDMEKENMEYDFYRGLLSRLLLSAVIEGDRRDTAEFMHDFRYPAFPEDKRIVWKNCLERMETKLCAFPSDTDMQRARQHISQQCKEFAVRTSGVYRLNVPTGAGKTLSSLRYALAHAQKYNKSHIIFTSPLLSILDQNAQVIRNYIQDDSLILEHHSNLVKTKEQGEQLDQQELMMENWSSPIVITTMVQLLNTLFSGKTGCIRRMQALCNSVIVIDEVQTVPNHMLSLFNLAVNFLAELCHTTIVLCSATQPCLETVPHALRRQPEDIVPYDEALWNVFQRTELRNAGRMRLESIPSFAMDVLEETDSLLIVCNKKEQTKQIYQHLTDSAAYCYHLSADMCMAHRREVLQQLEASIARSRKTGEKTICVSTQVIEAGVDISFGRVIRLLAGMDSAVQAAGRCNRNGEIMAPVPVYLVECMDEDLRRLREIQRAKTASQALLEEYKKDSSSYQNDLASDEAIRYYYQSLYATMPEGFQDDTIKGKSSLFALLSSNSKYYDDDCACYGRYYLNQAFQMAGRLFQVFDSETTDVIVPYQKGKEIIKNICSDKAKHDILYLKEQQEQAKPYTISLYEWQREKLEDQNGLESVCDNRVLVLQEGFYHDETGLVLESGTQNYLEVGMECMI